MNHNYKISVIIPVYNVEDYIGRCLDSLVNQTLGIENIQVIAVNDCTPDNSMAVVEDYAKKYPSIEIVKHKTNQGQGAARNTGLSYAEGDYITFVDSDDFISENTYEVCLEKFEKYNCDLVIYEYEYYSESGKEYQRNPSGVLFDENQLVEDITQTPEIVFSTSLCNKVYPNKFKSLLKFPNTLYEDMVPTITIIFKSKRIYITNECKYHYRKRESGIKSTTDDFLEKTDSYRDFIFIHYELYTLLNEYPQYKPLIDWINARDTRYFVLDLILRNVFSHEERKEIFYKAKEYMGDVSEDTLKKFDPFWREFLRDVQKKSYWPFFIKYRSLYPRIKYKVLKIAKLMKLYYLRSLKVSQIAVSLFLSILYKRNPKSKGIWLLSERPSEAKDNGYRFFQYIREEHPEINAYYVIDKSCEEDYNRVKPLGNVIQHGSWKHKTLFMLSEKLITAHKGFIEPWNYRNFKRYFQRFTKEKKYIFLQHGIIGNGVMDFLGKRNPNNHFNLFICGAKPEFNYINNNFGYLPGEVAYTGLARFDYLKNQPKNQILIMPTWRTGIVQPSWVKNKVVEDEDFLSSEYFQRFQSIINNKKLMDLLEKHDFKLIFYPHYEVQQYLKYFKSSSNRVVLADKDSTDVQTLLMESKLLITDYSSVHFDFAYMNKPLVYYQFDREIFFKKHYKKGYFSFEDHGFGPVMESEEELIRFLESALENNFSMDPEYRTRTDDFFILKDDRNCERIYNEIMKLDQHYVVVDNLIDEIFKDHKQKLSFNGLDIYLHGNYIMYVADSIKRVNNKFFLEVSHDSQDFHEAPDLLNLDFFFKDLRVAEDKRSKYTDKNIAIVKIPKVKIKSIKIGQYINEEVKNLGEFILNKN
ncbi:bifunctional glycosyltransferase/CDP-glycerol:glycerophosphate glycerophosphotransferase [Methanobacterium congolense]|uniref:Minor teichoic acid biosynthesis protein GgaB n=1 Tax=Methanobacterium congolense TaxID=118062 RepID=A0A1D3L3F6_9EURY|nr:CDP-glycerol glycerophosphotransferase family protein [Methanobacterium congolense]SCG86085.1 Minor teichoic acid biosynthesis protein GgaB [Methanobacterium congolense]